MLCASVLWCWLEAKKKMREGSSSATKVYIYIGVQVKFKFTTVAIAMVSKLYILCLMIEHIYKREFPRRALFIYRAYECLAWRTWSICAREYKILHLHYPFWLRSNFARVFRILCRHMDVGRVKRSRCRRRPTIIVATIIIVCILLCMPSMYITRMWVEWIYFSILFIPLRT